MEKIRLRVIITEENLYEFSALVDENLPYNRKIEKAKDMVTDYLKMFSPSPFNSHPDSPVQCTNLEPSFGDIVGEPRFLPKSVICRMRKDLIEDKLAIPIGDGLYITGSPDFTFVSRWVEDDFQIQIRGNWFTVESADFEFIEP